MKINTLANDVKAARQIIEDNAKYYNSQWKKDQLKALKIATLNAYHEAISEVELLIASYDKKLKDIQNVPFLGFNITTEYLENVKYTKSRLLAEMKISPEQKNTLIEKALSSKIGAQAVLELIQSNELDNSYWTDATLKTAFINSKTQKELEWELDKARQIESLKKEQSEKVNFGSYYAALKTINGDVMLHVPTLETMLDNEIAAIDKEEKITRVDVNAANKSINDNQTTV